jgi:hypothetical protein
MKGVIFMLDYVKNNTRLMREWHYEKNKEIDINNITSGSSKKVWWKCDKGHSYLREIYNQRKGYGKCPICRKEK